MDIFEEVSVFSDRPEYEKHKSNLDELIRTENIDKFKQDLKNDGWDDVDTTYVDFMYRMSIGGSINNDFEAMAVCVTLKSLFPEKTESIEFIMNDLIEGTDNRANYVDLFDLVPNSTLIIPLMAYMS